MIFLQKYYLSNALSHFVYISLLTILNIVIKMLGNNDTTIQVDLRKRSSIKDEIMYSNLDVQSCMVVLVVIGVLLLSVISVAAAQAPII
jgi:hypothetical protein